MCKTPLQDRLVQDLPLAGLATIAAADRHRPRPVRRDLDRSLCRKTTRVLRREWTGAYHGPRDQIHDHGRAPHGQVEERIEGTRQLPPHGPPRRSHGITARPVRVRAPSPPAAPRRPVTPKPTHPWRRRVWLDRHTTAATPMR